MLFQRWSVTLSQQVVENKLIEMDWDLNNAGIQCMKDVQNIPGEKKPSDRYTSNIPT